MSIILDGVTFNNGGSCTFDGNDVKQIDFNGTTVWKAETILFPDGILSWGKKGANASSCSVTSSQLVAKSSTSNTNGRIVSTATLDVSSYSTITFTVSARSKSGNAGIWVGTTTNSNGVSTNSSMTSYTAVSGAGTYTVDISSLTARQYVQVACWGSTGSASCTVTNIVAN